MNYIQSKASGIAATLFQSQPVSFCIFSFPFCLHSYFFFVTHLCSRLRNPSVFSIRKKPKRNPHTATAMIINVCISSPPKRIYKMRAWIFTTHNIYTTWILATPEGYETVISDAFPSKCLPIPPPHFYILIFCVYPHFLHLYTLLISHGIFVAF